MAFYRSPTQRPKYTIDFNESVYTSYEYDDQNCHYVFTVEQGTRFFLKLKLTANPMPCTAELLKNGATVRSSQYATIYVKIDRICIQTVYGQGYAGVYMLRCNNGLEGKISFELKVKDTPGYSQSDDYNDCDDPSRW